jgi:hypothetical protein
VTTPADNPRKDKAMKLIFHILWKDVRQLWRELAVSLALIVAYGWSVPHQWAHPGLASVAASGIRGLAGAFDAEFWPRLLVVLVPGAWLFLAVRVVQSDSLVGDRQFWVTRPYDWKQLLAAKLVFILVSVNLPMLILDLYLLSRAGFVPTHYILGLLWMQWLITLILLTPVTALATVTTTVVQLLLGLFVIFLYMVGSSFVSQRIPPSEFTSTEPLPTILLIATALAVIGLQYARRRTVLSRSLVLCLMTCLVLITVLAPYRTLVHRQYPPLQAGQQPPIQLAISGNLGTWTSHGKSDPKQVGIVLPLTITRTDPDSILIIKGARVEVDGQDGLRWDDDWTSMNSLNLMPQDNNISVNFALSRDFYEQVRYSGVKVRVTLAFSYFQDANRRTFIVPSGTFALPEGGVCSAAPADPQVYSDRLRMALCFAPLHRPTSLLLNLKFSESTCPLPTDAPAITDGSFGTEWIQSSDSRPEFGISPVTQFGLAAFRYHIGESSNASAYRDNSLLALHGVCPGTPLTLSNPQKVRDTQITQQLNNVHLPDTGKFLSTTGLW